MSERFKVVLDHARRYTSAQLYLFYLYLHYSWRRPHNPPSNTVNGRCVDNIVAAGQRHRSLIWQNLNCALLTITRLPSNLRPITRECVHLVTRGHFQSLDKDGRHTIHICQIRKPHQGLYRNLTVVFQTFPGQNYFFFPDFQGILFIFMWIKTLENCLLNAKISYTMYSSILNIEWDSNF